MNRKPVTTFDLVRIRRLVEAGCTLREIASMTGIDYALVQRYVAMLVRHPQKPDSDKGNIST